MTRINGFFKYPDLNQVGGLTATIQIFRKTRNNKIKGTLTTRTMGAVGKNPCWLANRKRQFQVRHFALDVCDLYRFSYRKTWKNNFTWRDCRIEFPVNSSVWFSNVKSPLFTHWLKLYLCTYQKDWLSFFVRTWYKQIFR